MPHANGSPPPWEHFEHGADVGVRGRGASAAEAFAAAAVALTAVVTDPTRVAPRKAVAIEVREATLELLLVAWLDALIYAMAVRTMLFGRFEVAVTKEGEAWRLTATAWGEGVAVARHRPTVEVKGATFTELRAGPTATGGWIAQCVVDV